MRGSGHEVFRDRMWPIFKQIGGYLQVWKERDGFIMPTSESLNPEPQTLNPAPLRPHTLSAPGHMLQCTAHWLTLFTVVRTSASLGATNAWFGFRV